MKFRIIGIGSDGKEYTNNDTSKECEYPCIVDYKEKPTEEQLREDAGNALVMLQFDLPDGVKFIKCRWELIET